MLTNIFTFDSKFYKNNGESVDLNNKKILIDEFYQSPKKWITTIYLLKQRYPKMILQFYGDSYQTKPVETCTMCKYEDEWMKRVIHYVTNGINILIIMCLWKWLVIIC